MSRDRNFTLQELRKYFGMNFYLSVCLNLEKIIFCKNNEQLTLITEKIKFTTIRTNLFWSKIHLFFYV